jgi:hypothetical protein
MGRAVVALMLLSALAGCAKQMSPAQSRAWASGTVEVGMARIEVERQLGFPQRVEKVGNISFFYYTPLWYNTTFWGGSQNPIAIADGVVVGMGKAYHASVVAGASAQAKSN